MHFPLRSSECFAGNFDDDDDGVFFHNYDDDDDDNLDW